MDAVEYVLLFIITVIGVGGIIAVYLHYKMPDYEIDKMISNNTKLYELIQIKYNINNFENVQNRKLDYDTTMMFNMLKDIEIRRDRDRDNHKLSIMMMQMTLEERRQQIINNAKMIDQNYELEMLRVSQIGLLQKELKELEIEGIKAKIDGKKFKSLFEQEKYTQEQQRTIREQELHTLHKAMEALTSKSEFMSRFGEAFKEQKEKQKLEEYLNEMKSDSDKIFSKFDIL